MPPACLPLLLSPRFPLSWPVVHGCVLAAPIVTVWRPAQRAAATWVMVQVASLEASAAALKEAAEKTGAEETVVVTATAPSAMAEPLVRLPAGTASEMVAEADQEAEATMAVEMVALAEMAAAVGLMVGMAAATAASMRTLRVDSPKLTRSGCICRARRFRMQGFHTRCSHRQPGRRCRPGKCTCRPTLPLSGRG